MMHPKNDLEQSKLTYFLYTAPVHLSIKILGLFLAEPYLWTWKK